MKIGIINGVLKSNVILLLFYFGIFNPYYVQFMIGRGARCICIDQSRHRLVQRIGVGIMTEIPKVID